uniref:BED-type domain-containing protein n=1 Tax=Astyanax mexicanus TaxID=7994 RepID=A0A8B9H2A4_ASTMX
HTICKLCNAKIKYSGNTTNLRTHLARHHSDVELSVLYFICKDMRPLRVVENEGFRNMVNIMEPRYTLPSRQHITDIAVPRLYKEVKARVAEALSSTDRVALTCDAWTSRATESYVTITAHHVTEKWELDTYVLQTRALHVSHTGENIADLLKEAVTEWRLEAKDPVIVTDNASNMNIAAKRADMTHIRCFAHSLNLASQKAPKLPKVERLLSRIRLVTTFFRRSTIASHQLKQKQDLLQLPKHRLITDVVTRWNSSYDMIERFLEQQPEICAALLSTEVRKSEKDVFTLSETDITCAEEVLKALKPMKDATLVMSEESMPTLAIVAPLHAKLVMGTEESSEDTQTVKEIKTVIAQDLGKRYGSEKETLCMASALDPRFKDLPFLSEKQQNVTLLDLLRATFASTKDNAAQKSTHDVAAAEIKRFREETPLPLTENPLSWWKEHEHEYPQLSRVAKSFLCIPGTSVSAERVFSTAGDIVTAQRSVLKAEHVDQLVFLHKNLDIKNKR